MRILFVDATAAFTPVMMADQPTGGICTSLNILPRKLAELGHEVLVYSPHLKEDSGSDGVKWLAQDPTRPAICPDVVIYNRNFIDNSMLQFFAPAKSVLWLHDIPQFGYFTDDAITRVDRIVALSEYQRQSFADFYDASNERFLIIQNGIDPAIFHNRLGPHRDPHLFIHASAPIKGGLELLGALYQVMKLRDPLFRLVSYCSQSLHKLDNEPFAEKLGKLKSLGVEVSDPIPQHELADVMRKAWLLLMPNTYPENCSNVMLQAQACGLPVVASSIGDLAEKTPMDGVITTATKPHDLFWHYKEFIDLAISCAGERHEYLSRCGPKAVKTWNQIAEEWNGMLESLVVRTAGNFSGTNTSSRKEPAGIADPPSCEQGAELGR